MRNRIRFFVIIALTDCRRGCLAVSTSTEELDDTNLFWMNESRNLKEPHWSSDSDNMFLTGSNLSSLGKLALSKTTISDEDSTPSIVLDTTKITTETKDTISSPLPRVENRVKEKAINANNPEATKNHHVVAGESAKISHNEIDVMEEPPVEVRDIKDKGNVIFEVMQEKEEEKVNKYDSSVQIPVSVDEKVVATLSGENDSRNIHSHQSNTTKHIDFLNKDESPDVLTAETVSSNTTVLETLDHHSNVTEGRPLLDKNLHELGDPPVRVPLEKNASIIPEDESNNKYFFQANNSTIDETTNLNDERDKDDEGRSEPEIESLSAMTARRFNDTVEYDSELIDFDELSKKEFIDLENTGVQDEISTLDIQSQDHSNSTGFLESSETITVTSGLEAKVMDVVPHADKRQPKEGSLAEFFKKVSPENDMKSPNTKHQIVSTTQSEVLKEIPVTNKFIEKEKGLAPASENLSYIATYPNHTDETGIMTSDSEKNDSDEILFGYTSIWGKKKYVLDKKLPKFNVQSNPVPEGQTNSETEAESPRAGATISETFHNQTLIDDAALKKGDNRMDADQVKSVNDEFVKGLDDIDKLFENVQPPDELDVGAAGSSIQEVLMGQGARILRKRVGLIIDHVKTFFSRHRGTEHFALISKDVIEDSLRRLMQVSHRFVRKVHDFIMEMIYGADGDILDFDVIVAEEVRKLENLRKAKVKEERDEMSSMDTAIDDKHTAAEDKLEAFMQHRLAMHSQ